MSNAEFQLANGMAVKMITVVHYDGARTTIHAEDVDRWIRTPLKDFQENKEEHERLSETIKHHEDKHSQRLHGRLPDRLEQVLALYERIAVDALTGAESVRDDMLVYMRSISFMLQTVIADHISHAEKGARVRGVIAVVEQHIDSLRNERFDFHNSSWRRSPDLFRWNENERRLRDQIRELQKLLEKGGTKEVPTGQGEDIDF
jgi:hypothetical protein